VTMASSCSRALQGRYSAGNGKLECTLATEVIPRSLSFPQTPSLVRDPEPAVPWPPGPLGPCVAGGTDQRVPGRDRAILEVWRGGWSSYGKERPIASVPSSRHSRTTLRSRSAGTDGRRSADASASPSRPSDGTAGNVADASRRHGTRSTSSWRTRLPRNTTVRICSSGASGIRRSGSPAPSAMRPGFSWIDAIKS